MLLRLSLQQFNDELQSLISAWRGFALSLLLSKMKEQIPSLGFEFSQGDRSKQCWNKISRCCVASSSLLPNRKTEGKQKERVQMHLFIYGANYPCLSIVLYTTNYLFSEGMWQAILKSMKEYKDFCS